MASTPEGDDQGRKGPAGDDGKGGGPLRRRGKALLVLFGVALFMYISIMFKIIKFGP